MSNLFAIDEPLLPMALGAISVLVLALIWLAYRRRIRLDADSMIRSVTTDMLAHFLIPDGDGGEIHVEYALLTPRGVIVIDTKEVDGNVFGSNAMQDWTVISDRKRFTFGNPQHALYDRMAAVKRFMPQVPVTGFVAFTSRAKFSKGQPNNVILLDKLVNELKAERKARRGESLDSFYPQWDSLRDEAVAAQVGRLLQK